MPASPVLWPPPRRVRWLPGAVSLRGRRSPPLPSARLTKALERTPSLLCPKGGLRVTTRAADLPHQGYRLRIAPGQGVSISAADEAGAFHALQTYRQLAGEGEEVPAVEIEDAPDFLHRGVMLDISRCRVPSMATLFEWVELMALLKFNQLQLYTEHTFAFPGHEEVWGASSPMTGEEVRALDAFCRDRGIELVPNLNSFGHFERWLRHPTYQRLAESADGYTTPWGERRHEGSTLRPNAASLRFLDTLHEAFLPHFSSTTFNIGGDEPWELGQGWSRPLCERRGKHRVYLDFLRAIHRRVTERGRRMQFWADIVLEQPDLVAELPAGLVALVWGYERDHPFEAQCAAFAKAGLEFHVCPGTSAWNSLCGRTDNHLANISAAARHGRASGARGLLVTDWGDGGHHQGWAISLPGHVWGAAQAWNGADAQEPDLVKALDAWVLPPEASGLGNRLLSLGRLPNHLGQRLHNSTPFHHFLFKADPGANEKVAQISASEIRRAVRAARGTEEDLAALASSAEAREALLAARLVRLSCEIRLGQICPAGSRKKARLRGDLTAAIGEFETVWLGRHRPGGLYESSGHLRAALARLR